MTSNPVPSDTRPRARRASSTTAAVLAVGALLLGACGDDDEESAATTTADAAAEETTPTAVENTIEESMNTTAADDEAAAAPAVPDALVGTWESVTDRELTLNADGTMIVSEGDEVLAENTWTATPTTIELNPETGPLACADAATYEWEIVDDTLTLVAVSDSCAGRREGLDGVSRTRAETTFSPSGTADAGDQTTISDGLTEVTADETVETRRLGGLRFVVPQDRELFQAPGLVALGGVPTEIALVAVVETLEGEPIDSTDTVVELIDEATVSLEELDPTTVAGHQARVIDFTAEREGVPRPEDAVFRFEEGGIGGWGPIGEGRAWLLETPRGIQLFSAGALEPGEADLADVIAEAEALFATLEFIETAS